MKKLQFIFAICLLTFAISCGQQKRYVSYKVKEGETLRTIAKQYNLKTKDLIRLNPEVDRKPKPNTIIIIPNPNKKNTQITKNTTQNTPKNEDKIAPKTPPEKQIEAIKNTNPDLEDLKKKFVIHKVKAKETVYGVTRFFNITEETLFNLNPSVKKEGLKIDQVIKIRPIKTEEDKEANNLFEDTITAGSSVNVALLLPFRATEYINKEAQDIFSKNKSLTNIVTDFYMGAEIAIDSIKKQGVDVTVKIFDTGKKNSDIKTIVLNPYLKKADIIIGPFYYEEAKIITRTVDVPVIFPMHSKNQNRLNTSKIIKTAPNKNSYLDILTSYLRETYHGENIIIVGDGKADSNLKINKIVANLKQHDSITNIQILKPQKGYIKKERFIDLMKPKTHSWILVISDDHVVVADALNSMISLPESVSAQVFAIEKTKAFNRVDNFKLAQVNFSYVTNEYIGENTYAIKEFNKKYKNLNNTLPSYYATKGFDITYDILARLTSSNGNLEEALSLGDSYRLVSKFDYHKNLFGSTSNKGLFIVKYNDDLSVTRLK